MEVTDQADYNSHAFPLISFLTDLIIIMRMRFCVNLFLFESSTKPSGDGLLIIDDL